LALLFSFACMTVPRNADAAVTASQNWRNTAATLNTGTLTGTRYFRGTTAVPGTTNNLGTMPAGTTRLLVVALAINTTAAGVGPVPTVQYGLAGSENKTLALATTDQGSTSRQHTWLFYLKESDIAAANGTNLRFTYTGGSTYTGTYANAAVYNGVDQTAPLPFQYQTTYNSTTANTTMGPLATSQVVVAGDYAVEVVNALNTASATTPTVTLQTGWTARGNTATTGTNWGRRTEIAYRTTAGNFTSQHTSSLAVVDSISAMTIKQNPVPGITNGTTVPNIDVYANDLNKVVDAFTVTGGGTLTGLTITTSASTTRANVSAVKVYRKLVTNTNNTIYQAGDVQIGSGTAGTPTTSVTGLTENIVSGTNYIITYDINPAAIGNGTSITLTGRVTAITPTGGTVTDTAGATLTVLVTTSILDAT